jgi:hypothetical protein
MKKKKLKKKVKKLEKQLEVLAAIEIDFKTFGSITRYQEITKHNILNRYL